MIISNVNNKGGIGKTTSTACTAEILAYLGKKVLLVDLCDQSNLTMRFGAYKEDSKEVIAGMENAEEQNIAELFKYRYKTEEQVASLIRPTRTKGIDIIPSSKRHKNTIMVMAMNQSGNPNIILKNALNAVKNRYDYILIDNAPANNILTINSLMASDQILIPVRLGIYSYKGLRETLDSINEIKEEYGITSLNFLGAFVTQVDTNTNLYKEFYEEAKEALGDKLFNTSIRKDIRINELENTQQSVLEYCPNSNGMFDYCNLILELGILDETAEKRLRDSIGEE